MNKELLVFSPEVQDAMANNKPIVALESTIISHGMPYPQNVDMANKTEDIIREAGAVPATIALMNGKIKIGLTEEDLEVLATAENVSKVSRRDMARILADGSLGATTVASTMIAAHAAGIKVFVTGGIGGVHRGGEDTMDISADLEELAQTNVTVVCAGAKAILDLPRTLEYLETHGVPVFGLQTDTLPAFYSSESDIAIPNRIEATEELANIMRQTDALGFPAGHLLTVPVPKEHEIPAEEINEIIDRALAEEKEAGVSGKDSTPFLLANIVEKTEGRSLETNIQLVYNNAKHGAQLAVEYHNL